jgi:putative DNA primase/helicase
MLKFIDENIPAELRQIPQWVCWKAKPGKNGKIDKVPFDPKTGRAASSTDPATWGVFEQAVATSKNGGGYAGIGFVLNGGPYVGVDLDDCRNPETGDIQAWAWEIAQKLNTYTEISPSGKGLRMFLKGELKNPGRRKGKIECYVTGRFLTVTGHRVEGTPAAVMDRQQEILAFHESVFGKQKPPAKKQPPTQQATGLLSDDDIIARAKPGKDKVLARLWAGDISGYPSQSEADQALCNKLAFYTGKDPEQMDRLFRQSGLYRQKWEREDYRTQTIEDAMEYVQEVYTGGRISAEEAFALDWDGTPEGGRASFRPGDFTDVGQARVLARVYGNLLRFTTATNYLVYDGKVWNESSVKAHELAQQLTEQQLAEAREQLAAAQKAEDEAAVSGDEDAKRDAHLAIVNAKGYRSYVLACRKTSKIAAALKEAQPMLAIKVDELDADPFLLNTPGGTVNLKTGELKPHDAYDLCTKITTVSPGNKGAELFADFLNVITCGDKELENHLQVIAGMAAIGKVFSELLIIAYGGGRNGKSTFFNLIARAMGSYSGGLSAELLTINNRQNKKPEFAELRGKRLVITGELEEGMRLDTAVVKKLCSTDPIRAEKKYKDPFDFIPSHTIVLYTNHLPKVGTSDAGTWRRLVVVPFNAVIEGSADIKNYTDYLLTHAGGAVMAWIIEGAARFIQGGYRIDPPECVKQAIREYRHANDWLNHFLTERCEIDPRYFERAGNLYYKYREYCAGTGEYTRSAADFTAAITGAGFERRKTSKGFFIYGLRLISEFQ